MKPETNRLISLALLIVVILNFLLFIFRKITNKVFWLILAFAALYVYFVMPKLKKKK